MIVWEIVGWFGMIMLLAAYALISWNKLNNKSLLYQTMNFVGGTGAAINLVVHKSWPIFTLESIWAFIGLVACICIIKNRLSSQAVAEGDER